MAIQDLKFLNTDKLKRSFVLPQRILWKGEGVENGEFILQSELSQIFVGMRNLTKLSTQNNLSSGILLDFGSEMVGSVELLVSKVSNPYGVKLRLRFGESVSEAMSPIGVKNATNDHAVRDMSVVVTNWSQQTFGYTGFRFVYIEIEDADAWVELSAVRAIFTYRDIPYLGSFQCDNESLNEIYHISAYTVHLNMQNMLWDGIKRDRLVWIGDTHPEMLAIRSVFGENEVIEEALKFISETNVLPQWPNKHTTYALWYLMILWDWYWYTGKKELVEELKDYWMGQTEQLLSLVHLGEEELLREEEFVAGFFVDWPTKGTEGAKTGVYALYRLGLQAAGNLCEVLGEKKLQETCRCCADAIGKEKYNHNNSKQIVGLMQLAGMIEPKEAADILTANGGQGMSTFLSYYILSAVCHTADMEDALLMLEEYYGAMLKAGATSFWEDFDLKWYKEGARIDEVLEEGAYDIHGDNGRFCYQGMRHSLCHGWSAGPAAFLAEYVLGVKILEPGCRRLEIKPNLGSLKWAKGTYPTPHGIVEIDVKNENGSLKVHVNAPQGIQVKVPN